MSIATSVLKILLGLVSLVAGIRLLETAEYKVKNYWAQCAVAACGVACIYAMLFLCISALWHP